MVDHLIDKQRVAESFSRAAPTYDRVADLQRSVGEHLLSLLPNETSPTAMDLGCGTGYFTPALQSASRCTTLVNLDLAMGMLQYARNHRPAKNALWVCADAESLPLADESLDLIFSSLAIQWCENLPQLFNEVARTLSPGGSFVFATLGPNTLAELRTAWQAADNYVHVNRFLSEASIRQAIPETLHLQQLHEENRILKYNELRELTDELKGIGAHNMNSGQHVGLTGRKKIRRFMQAYEEQRDAQGQLPATYQVYYGILTKHSHN